MGKTFGQAARGGGRDDRGSSFFGAGKNKNESGGAVGGRHRSGKTTAGKGGKGRRESGPSAPERRPGSFSAWYNGDDKKK